MTLSSLLSSLTPSASTVAVCEAANHQTALISFEQCSDFVELLVDGAMNLFEEAGLANINRIQGQRVYIQYFDAPYAEVLAYSAIAAGSGVNLLCEADF